MNRPILGVGLLLALLPILLQGHYLMGISVLVGIFSLATLGLDLLFGYTGQLSLGQAAFMGIGAYTTGILTVKLGLSPLLALVTGGVLAGAFALLVGGPVLKLRGYYLVLVTLAGGQVCEMVLVGWRNLTGGPSGLAGVPQFQLGGFTFSSDIHYHYFVWALVLLVLVGLQHLVSGRVGRALKAIAADDVAAGVLGVDVAAFKLKVFVVSAVLAGIAGSLYAHYMQFISPDMVGIQTSFSLVIMLVLGGVGRLWGVLVGVTLLKVLPQVIGWMQDYQLIIHGLLLMVVMVCMPQGIMGAVRAYLDRREVVVRGRLAAGERSQ